MLRCCDATLKYPSSGFRGIDFDQKIAEEMSLEALENELEAIEVLLNDKEWVPMNEKGEQIQPKSIRLEILRYQSAHGMNAKSFQELIKVDNNSYTMFMKEGGALNLDAHNTYICAAKLMATAPLLMKIDALKVKAQEQEHEQQEQHSYTMFMKDEDTLNLVGSPVGSSVSSSMFFEVDPDDRTKRRYTKPMPIPIPIPISGVEQEEQFRRNLELDTSSGSPKHPPVVGMHPPLCVVLPEAPQNAANTVPVPVPIAVTEEDLVLGAVAGSVKHLQIS